MKFIHVADLHLDTPFLGVAKRINKRHQALVNAPYEAFDRCVTVAIKEDVDCMVIVGDIYDSKEQTIYAQHFFVQQLERLNEAGIPVVLSFGNHDMLDNPNRLNAYPDNVYAFSNQDVSHFDLELRNGDTARFYGFSYETQWIKERKIKDFPVNPKETTYTIGMIHGEVDSLESQTGNYAPFSRQELLSKNYDYWALGHIHMPLEINKSPIIQYSGTTQGRHRNETGDHGAYLIELSTSEPAKSEFISLAPIIWEKIEIECQSTWQAADVAKEAQGVIENYRTESLANQKSYLLDIEFTQSQRLDVTLSKQIEDGELLQSLDPVDQDGLFVEVFRVSQTATYQVEPFSYDPKLNESFNEAVKELEEGDLYQDVLSSVFNHSIIKDWLSHLQEDKDLQAEITKEARNLVVEAIGLQLQDSGVAKDED